MSGSSCENGDNPALGLGGRGKHGKRWHIIQLTVEK
jgi:hypothetical protein